MGVEGLIGLPPPSPIEGESTDGGGREESQVVRASLDHAICILNRLIYCLP